MAERCGRLLVVCPADVMPLLATLPGVAQLRDAGSLTVAEYDTYLPLASIPHVLGTTRATIPAAVPYLDMRALRRRRGDPTALPSLTPSVRPKVGVVWAETPSDRHDRSRSSALSAWLPLLRLPGMDFYSLQTGKPQQELDALPPGVSIQNLAPALHDLADAAILLDQLDLLLTVDTPVAHLAGALGKPAWVLLSAVPEWRWGFEVEETPWYPTMRLFRQARTEDWAEMIERSAMALVAWGERSKVENRVPTR